jgi:hypothetical protein
VGFLCVSSNDLANVSTTTPSINLTTTAAPIQELILMNATNERTSESVDDSGEKSLESIVLTPPEEKWRDFDVQHANSKL